MVGKKYQVLFGTLIILACSLTLSAKNIYVDVSAGGDDNGTSWQHAYNDLQDALSEAVSGNEVWVAEGTYKPTDPGGDRGIYFDVKSGVELYGGFPAGGGVWEARDPWIYDTIVSGDLNGNDGSNFSNYDDNSYTVVDVSNSNNDTIVDGLIVQGGNAPSYGGGMAIYSGNPIIRNCRFRLNKSGYRAGGIYLQDSSSPEIENCIIEDNFAKEGGGIHGYTQCNPTIKNCQFLRNETSVWSGGGGYFRDKSSPVILNCVISENQTGANSGAFHFHGGNVFVKNCLFVNNSAGLNGGAIENYDNAFTTVINCTFWGNSAGDNGGAIANTNSDTLLQNTIIWNSTDQNGFGFISQVYGGDDGNRQYCCIQNYESGFGGVGNTGDDPQFVNPAGGDFKLLPDSPCIDGGMEVDNPVDIDGNPRPFNYPGVDNNGALADYDMGAYEMIVTDAQGTYHVDTVSGDDGNSGLSRDAAFATISKGLEVAEDGDVVLVWPGVYGESVNFGGKAITVKSAAEAAVIDAGIGVWSDSGEEPNSVLANFIIQNCAMGAFCVDSSPTLRNLTVVNNDYGIVSYGSGGPEVSNCILWGNVNDDLYICTAEYSCVEDGDGGLGNISDDPIFADAAGGDYHLRSERGRYDPELDLWVLDEATSPGVDGGDPVENPMGERMPNGARVNMGAYGGTGWASMSKWPTAADVNRDGVVNLVDYSIWTEKWLWAAPWLE